MQKKLIALAVAGLASGAAFADNASIYGVVDAAWVNTSGSGIRSANTVVAGGLSASRIGLNASEDLGNGTKAIVNLEYALDTQNNTGMGAADGIVNSATVARQQLLGLTGGWGTFATGYLQTAGYDFGSKYDVTAGTAVSPLQSITKGFGRGLAIGAAAGASRAGSALAYISPNMSGFTVAVNHADLNQANVANPSGTNTDKTAWLLSGNYDNGPMAVGLVYARLAGATNSSVTTLVNDDRWTEWALGGSYNAGVATIKATYQSGHASGSGLSSTQTSNRKAYSLGGVIPAGPGAVVVSYAKLSDSTVTNQNASGYTLGYLYSMSKRTTAYMTYSHMSQDSASNFYTVDNSALATVGSLGGSTSMVALGLNHKF